MQLSMKFAVLAVLVQVSVVFSSPIGDATGDYSNTLAARAPKKVPTQAECEASCNMLLFAGQITQAQWQGCVNNCLGILTPPPTPPQQRPAVVKKPRAVLDERAPKKVPTQAECEASCNMLLFAGQITQAQWQGCVNNCLGILTPPPTPPRQRPAVVKKPREELIARAPKKVPTQAECEASCNMLLFAGQITQAQWQGCVNNCLGILTPPPTPPQQRPAVIKKPRSELNERAPKKVPTQAECEGSCNLLLFAGQITQAQWQGCVNNCLGVLTPPPSPQQKPVKPVVKKPRAVLSERAPKKVPTQAECEAGCNMLLFAGQITQAQWQGCVNNCLGVLTPPPSPQQKPAIKPVKVGGRDFDEDEE